MIQWPVSGLTNCCISFSNDDWTGSGRTEEVADNLAPNTAASFVPFPSPPTS